MGKYFGTDGFRGEANKNLNYEHAIKIGRFLGWYYGARLDKKAKIVIGKDTRRSSYMFEYALCAGLTASGADAYIMHVTTTPSVSYIARTDDFDCGIMISASHNPFYDNGIKLMNSNGEKMDEETILEVERYLDGETEVPLALREEIGRTVDYVAGRNRYIGYLISLSKYSFNGKRVGLDVANGSAWSIAKGVFDALGAKTYVINNDPYVRRTTNGISEFMNVRTAENDISFMDDTFLAVLGKLFVLESKKGKHTYMKLYNYPKMDVVLNAKYTFVAGICNKDNYYIYTE